jgi:hypothetical protein
MRARLAILALGVLFATAPLPGQNSEEVRAKGPGSTSSQISQSNKRAERTAKGGKPVLPDPDIFDGSIYEAEKRPLYAMQSEIEMGEKEGPKDSEKVSPDSGPQGGSGGEQEQQGGSAADPEKKRAQPGGTQTQPEGIKVADLKIPEGANPASQNDIPPPPKPRDLQIGDATLQIQTIPMAAQKDVIGNQSSTAQQAAKKIPQGQQTDNRNKGSEKGKVVPKGL